MAPTTIAGQKTATSRGGRDIKRDGFPLKISEMISILNGVKYVERVSVHEPKEILKAKKAIKKAFEIQIRNEGFSMVEVLAMCPTYWGLTALESCKRIKEEVVKTYPLGILKGER